MWVGGCVTAPVAWTSGPSALASRGPWGRRCRRTRGPARSRERPWVCRSAHRSAKMASRRRFGAFVYTVATLRAAVVTQECTQIGEDGLSEPFRGICVHCCAAAGRRGDAGVYTDRRRWALGATTARMQNAPFGEAHTQNAPFRESDTPRVRLYVSRRVQSGVLVHAVAPQFAETSTHTNPRRAQLLRGYYTSSGLTAGRCGRQRRTRRQRPARSGTPRRSGPPSDPRSFGS